MHVAQLVRSASDTPPTSSLLDLHKSQIVLGSARCDVVLKAVVPPSLASRKLSSA